MAVVVKTRQQALLSAADLSELLGVEAKTLANWRCQGKGPRSIKVGRLVRYRMSDVEQWLASREQENGAD
jgi:predicted DNA-binding transcriptional regulator AlpA